MVVHGNHLEDLRDLLVEWLARTPLAPLEDETMLVQSNGIAQWLQLALARPRGAGGMGISAAVEMQLPGRFLWRAYRAVLGREAVPADSPFDKSRLAWRLMRLLPTQLGHADFAPLRHFLGEGQADPGKSDPIKLFQLAQQIADLFDQYQVYRADWLDDWEHGRDVLRDDLRTRHESLPASQRWQAKLWRTEHISDGSNSVGPPLSPGGAPPAHIAGSPHGQRRFRAAHTWALPTRGLTNLLSSH